MSKDTIKLVCSIKQKKLEMQMALQCAPLFIGIKISNLLIINSRERERVKRIIKHTMLSYYILFKTDTKVIFLLYDRFLLMKYLQKQENKDLLYKFGYRNYEQIELLKEFSKHYCNYKKGKSEFPHEMGIFLGYPTEDVKGFIEKKGKGFLYTGYWKVYADLEEKIKLFEQYDMAKEKVIGSIMQGMSISFFLTVYYPRQDGLKQVI